MSQLTTASISHLMVAGLRSELNQILGKLAHLGAVHIEEHDGLVEGFTLGTPEEDANESSRVLARFRGAASQLVESGLNEPLESSLIRKRLDDGLTDDVEYVLEFLSELEKARNELSQVKVALASVDLVKPLGLDYDLLQGYESLSTFMGTVDNLPKLVLSLDTSPFSTLLHSVPNGRKKGTISLFTHVSDGSEVSEILATVGFSPVQLPKGEVLSEVVSKLQTEHDSLVEKITSLEADISEWESNYGVQLLGGMELIERDLVTQKAPVLVAVSEYAFLLEGWVEDPRVQEVISEIEPFASIVEVTPWEKGHSSHHEVEDEAPLSPPVAFEPRIAAKPFEIFTDAMGRPHYGRVDPTSFMLITYPLFFGIMLGDIAYGLATLGIAWFINNRFGKDEFPRQIALLFAYLGGSTVLFGYIYGEFAGFDITHTLLYPHHHWEVHLPFNVVLAYPYHRVGHNMMDLMLLTIYLGVIHLAVGLLIGFRDVFSSHGFKVAVFEKGSWLMIIFGGFLAVYAFLAGEGHTDENYLSYLSIMAYIGGTWAIIGLVFLVLNLWIYEGFDLPMALFLGPLESISLFSNSISYVRLFAVGVAGVKIAEIGNEMVFHEALHLLHGHEFEAFVVLAPLWLPLVIKATSKWWPEGIATTIGSRFGTFLLAGLLLSTILGFASGFGFTIPLITLLLAGWFFVHLFALGLGLFSPNIQTARLHFVEWMGKFHEPGGRPFTAFAFVKKHVTEEAGMD